MKDILELSLTDFISIIQMMIDNKNREEGKPVIKKLNDKHKKLIEKYRNKQKK